MHLARPILTAMVMSCVAFPAVFLPAGQAGAAPDLPSDSEIRTILRNYIERDHWGVGMVVGIVDEHGTRIIPYGKLDGGESPEVNADTLFEIGSITKTFTTLLLEDMVQRGEMNLDDPVEKFLPASVRADDPAWGIRKRLRIRFRLGGKVRTAGAKEGESLELPAGAEVLRALYGNLPVKGQTVDVTEKVAALVKSGQGVIRAENALAVREVALKVPAWDSRKITLRDLATHRSGLPRDLNQWTVAGVYDLLSRYRLPRRPGRKVEYCNVGMALLAHAIEVKAGTNYAALVQERICRPLKMASTCITPTEGVGARWAKSHSLENRVAGDICDTSKELPGAGCIRSTASDMLKYVAANLGMINSPLTSLLEKTHEVQVARVFDQADLALPWWIFHEDGAALITHGGLTAGQTAFIGFDKKLKRGVVVLANRNDPLAQAVQPLGLFLLHPPTNKLAVADVARETLDSYAGLYECPALPQVITAIRRDRDHLVVQALNSAGGDWFPISATEFGHGREKEARLKFSGSAGSRLAAVFTKPHARTWRLRRVSDRAPEALFLPVPEPMGATNCAPRKGSDLQGNWEGTLRPWFWPFWSLPVKVRIIEPVAGSFRAEMDVPSQGANNQPLSVIYHPPGVELVVRSGSGMFKGKINQSHSKMTGHWIQGHFSVGLTLRCADRNDR